MFQFINQFFKSYDNAYEAAGKGDFNATKYLLENNKLDTYWKDNLYSAALHGGNIEVFKYVDKWLDSSGPFTKMKYTDDYLMNNAILQLVKTENTEMIWHVFHKVMFYTFEMRMSFMQKVCEYAVQLSKVSIIEFIDTLDMRVVSNDTNLWEDKTLFQAVRNDDIKMINYWMNKNSRLFLKMSDAEYAQLLHDCTTLSIGFHKKEAQYAIEHFINLHKNGMGYREEGKNHESSMMASFKQTASSFHPLK